MFFPSSELEDILIQTAASKLKAFVFIWTSAVFTSDSFLLTRNYYIYCYCNVICRENKPTNRVSLLPGQCSQHKLSAWLVLIKTEQFVLNHCIKTKGIWLHQQLNWTSAVFTSDSSLLTRNYYICCYCNVTCVLFLDTTLPSSVQTMNKTQPLTQRLAI